MHLAFGTGASLSRSLSLWSFRNSKNLGFLLSHTAVKACADRQSHDLSLRMYLAVEIDSSNAVCLVLIGCPQSCAAVPYVAHPRSIVCRLLIEAERGGPHEVTHMLYAEQSLSYMLGGGCWKLGQLTVGSAWVCSLHPMPDFAAVRRPDLRRAVDMSCSTGPRPEAARWTGVDGASSKN
jgi:hypothetical protein